jgi:hypothetical protein
VASCPSGKKFKFINIRKSNMLSLHTLYTVSLSLQCIFAYTILYLYILYVFIFYTVHVGGQMSSVGKRIGAIHIHDVVQRNNRACHRPVRGRPALMKGTMMLRRQQTDEASV